tara:strand:- start:283 stop:429 length:147 start_codon:yes stop_codon:yes gene_type:complete
MKKTNKIDLYNLLSENERDYLGQVICERLSENGLDPNNINWDLIAEKI